jgi:hypothetical protein
MTGQSLFCLVCTSNPCLMHTRNTHRITLHLTDESERKYYKATAKLRRDLSVPALSRGALASSNLSERDFTPVLSADPALFSHSSAPAHAHAIPEVGGALTSDALTEISNEMNPSVTRSSNSSSSSSSSSHVSRNNGTEGSSDELHPLPLYICSICDNMVHPAGTSECEPHRSCVMCRSVFHLRCCESERNSDAGHSDGSEVCAVEDVQFVCRICQTMSMIEDSSEALQNVTTSSVPRPSAVSARKRTRKVANEPRPDGEVPPKTRRPPRNRQSPTAKNKKDSATNASVASHSEYDSGIHPDILAALEACESSELT